MTSKMVSNPVSHEDAEEMLHCIYEAHAVGVILSRLEGAEEVDLSGIINCIGENLVRLLGQPMEAATGICTEKEGAAVASK